MNALHPRSFVLIATLVAIVLITLSAMGIAAIASVSAESVHTDGRRLQARALAWSGVQCVMLELARQRQDLLAARAPRITGEWTIFEVEGLPIERGVVRLLEVRNQPILPETGLLDLNHATRDQMAAATGDEAVAETVVRERGVRPFSSAEEVQPALAKSEAANAGTDPSNAEPEPAAETSAVESPFTVFAADPSVQIGLGPGGAGQLGQPRIDISGAWSDELHAALLDRLGQEYGSAVSEHLRTRGPITSLRDLVNILTARQLPIAEWPLFFDALACTPDEFRLGLIDVNNAPVEVLATVPGIDRDAADRIVLRRRALDPTLRRSVVWPLSEDLLTPEQFGLAVDTLTSRSLVWRFRVEAGFATGPSEPGRPSELQYRVCYEAVVDLVGPEPRLAYFRDLTALEYAESVAIPQARPAASPSDERPASADRPAAAPPPADVPSEPEPAPETEVPAEESSKPTGTQRLVPARIGRWTAGAPG